jgi:glycosyltransferase involved in cell wall biosynthesis
MSAPFFSIIIPTYNRAHILSRSIDSVFSQTYQDFELIIVDNGSTDNTQQWMSDHYQDSRIVYHYQKGSGSPASPRNTGVSLAQGQWVCLLDSDDKWSQDKLKCVYEAIQTNAGTDVICHNENVYFEETDSIGKTLRCGPSSKDMYKEMLIFGNRLSTSATSIRVKFLKDNTLQFNESNEFATVEDYDLWLNLARLGARFEFLPKSLGFYTIGDSNMIFTSGLFCKNLKNLLRLHVFNFQQFEKDKRKMWDLLRLRFDICQLHYTDLPISNKMARFIYIFFSHPINFTKLFIGYIKRKLLSLFIL